MERGAQDEPRIAPGHEVPRHSFAGRVRSLERELRRRLAVLGLACAALAPGAEAGGYLDAPPPDSNAFHAFGFAALGLNWNRCPQIDAALEFHRSWQLSLQLRSWFAEMQSAYDGIPEIDFHFRKLWLGADEGESLRNSEYVDVGFGVYPSRDYAGTPEGMRPQVRLTLGKFWMPTPSPLLGLDLNLSLGRYFNGNPPGPVNPDFVTSTFITATISFVYIFKTTQ